MFPYPGTTAPTLSLKDRSKKQQQQGISETDINQAKQAVWKDNEYSLIETEQRNVIFLGKTRSGKTTAVGVMKDPCYVPETYSLFSGTVNTKFQSFSIKDCRTGSVKQYTINIIDTPGVFEVKEKDKHNQRRTDAEIIGVIVDCLRNEVTKINVVVLFASFDAGVNEQDVQAISMFIKLFGNNKSTVESPAGSNSAENTTSNTNNSSSAALTSATSSTVDSATRSRAETRTLQLVLCVTGADRHDLAWQEQIRVDLAQHAVLGSLIENNDVKVCFIGCVDPQSGRYFNLEHLFDGYAFVSEMRSKLLKLILESSSSRQLLELDVMVQAKEVVIGVMDAMTKSFEFFNLVNDWQQTEVELRMEAHKELGQKLLRCKIFFRVPELSSHFALLLTEAHKLSNNSNVDKSLRTQLTWPLAIE